MSELINANDAATKGSMSPERAREEIKRWDKDQRTVKGLGEYLRAEGYLERDTQLWPVIEGLKITLIKAINWKKSDIHNFKQNTGQIAGAIDQDDFDAWVYELTVFEKALTLVYKAGFGKKDKETLEQ